MATDADRPPELRIAAVGLRGQRRLGGARLASRTLPLPDRFGPPCGVAQTPGRAVDLPPASPPHGSQQPFFFLLYPATAFLRDRAESTDPFVESDQVLAELTVGLELNIESWLEKRK
jgi:hypothetical protein